MAPSWLTSCVCVCVCDKLCAAGYLQEDSTDRCVQEFDLMEGKGSQGALVQEEP